MRKVVQLCQIEPYRGRSITCQIRLASKRVLEKEARERRAGRSKKRQERQKERKVSQI